MGNALTGEGMVGFKHKGIVLDGVKWRKQQWNEYRLDSETCVE